MKFRKIRFNSLAGNLWIDVLLLYSIPVDFLNGALQHIYGIHAPIGVCFRLTLMFVLMSKLQRKSSLKYPIGIDYLPLLFLFGTSAGMIYWAISAPWFNMVFEITELIKFCYYFLVIYYLYTQIGSLKLENVLRLTYIVYVFLGVFNLFCSMFGWGLLTYKSFNLGTKAFYADGNSFGLFMNMALPCAILYTLSAYRNRVYLFVGLLGGILGTYLIASRVAILGTSLTIFVVIFSLTFVNFHDLYKSIRVKIALWLLVIGIVWGGGILVCVWAPQMSDALTGRLTIESMSAARGDLTELGEDEIAEYTSWGDLIWGRGKYGAGVAFAKKMGFDVENKGVEADLHDSVLYYGWGFGGILILIHVLIWKYLVAGLCVRIDFKYLMIALSSTLWLALSIFAGHGFGNPLLAPLLGILFVVRYSKLPLMLLGDGKGV